MLVLPSLQSWAHQHIDVASEVGPIFIVWVDVMKPVYNFHPKYRITMLTREAWTTGPGTRPAVRGSTGIQMGPRHCSKPGSESMDIFWEKAQYLSRKICYTFQAEIYAILVCAYEIQMYSRQK